MFTSRTRWTGFRFKARLLFLPACSAALLWIGCTAIAGQGNPAKAKSSPPPVKMPSSDAPVCQACHGEIMARVQFEAVHEGTPISSAHKDLGCQDCHTSVEKFPHTPGAMQEKPTCSSCHADEDDAYHQSAHSRPDKVKGDHPTCLTCHGNGNPHAVRPAQSRTRSEVALLCSECHSDKGRMARYGVNTDAVASYDESFHGKAVLKFGNLKAASCIDCHGEHDVLPPDNPKSRTNRANADKLCSKPACHPGANLNFAMSGANHLRLMVKRGPILHGVDLFFRILAMSVIIFLTGGVGLDIRKKVFGPKAPRSGRIPAIVTTLSFLGMVCGLACGAFNLSTLATYMFLISIGVLVVGYLIYFGTKAELAKIIEPPKPQKQYQRLDLGLRLQHMLMILSFVLLVTTGFPLRFAQVDLLHAPWSLIGGLHGARLIHRIGAVGLTTTWLWHLCDLVWRWKKQHFSLRSMSMLPNRKDGHDFWVTALSYLGLSNEEPQYGRFQFRHKMGYFAVYWGAPIMILTGFVLWFPIYWGNRLPEQGLAIALVAHGEEATLALTAIIMWHLYDWHINPDNFPMSKTWWTGSVSQEDMERDHPLELKEPGA